MRALLCVQCFPPLVKQAGGVAKDYLALCRALIDGLGWHVTLMTPIDLSATGEAEVDRWLAAGLLRHLPVGGVRGWTPHGIGTFLDLYQFSTACILARELCFGGFDVCMMDDLLIRIAPILLARGLGVPTIVSTHTDVPGHDMYRYTLASRITWFWHVAAAFVATVHATVSAVWAETFRARYRAPVHAIWPPVLWSQTFLRPLEDFAERGARERKRWVDFLGFNPRAILLFAGRWSSEKRIKLLMDAVPAGCALVIVGDSDTQYADEIEDCRRHNVLPLRRMLNAEELRVAYAASDIFVSASCFETLGNVVVEAWASDLLVAVQPAGGHLEFVKDGQNSYFVDFDDPSAARKKLEAIVDAALSGADKSLRATLHEEGARLRRQDFPAAVREALLDPALAASEVWRRRWLLEPVLRAICLVAFVVFWLSAVLPVKAFYALSCEPRFRFVAPGSAVETTRDAA